MKQTFEKFNRKLNKKSILSIMTQKFYSLLIIGLFFFPCFTQAQKVFYQSENGKIFSEEEYQTFKNDFVKGMGKTLKKGSLNEVFETLYDSPDSVLRSFTWEMNFGKGSNFSERESDPAIQWIGKQFPIEKATLLTGEEITIQNLQDKPTLINLWFTSCAPCIKEMPALNEMIAEYSDQFNFLAITFESEAKVNRFLKKREFNFPHIVNSKELTLDAGFNAFPTNIFLDKTGVVQEIHSILPFEINPEGEHVFDIESFVKILSSLEG